VDAIHLFFWEALRELDSRKRYHTAGQNKATTHDARGAAEKNPSIAGHTIQKKTKRKKTDCVPRMTLRYSSLTFPP
jgi:hypothetical protein